MPEVSCHEARMKLSWLMTSSQIGIWTQPKILSAVSLYGLFSDMHCSPGLCKTLPDGAVFENANTKCREIRNQNLLF